MEKSLILSLIVFSVIWLFIIFHYIKNGKISVKYSMIWFLVTLIIFLVALTPKFMWKIAKILGFTTISNMVIGVVLTLLLLVTFVLTMIVTNQKSQINSLIQEVSILKNKE